MNITEEKEHIYSLMREITQERRKLTEIYFSLKERLDELNRLEQKGLGELSVKGYVDLFNQREREVAVANIERETKHVVEKINKESEKPEKINKKEIEIEKDRENKSKRAKRGEYLNLDKVMGSIAHVLKESGKPLSAKEIHKKVEEDMGVDIGIQNFRNNIMPRTIKKNKKINRATFGYYQYLN